METVAVIPAYNEEDSISSVVKETKKFVNRVVVVDDASTDCTARVSKEAGAEVIEHEKNKGYLATLKTGFRSVDADIIVTLDADGEMDPAFIPKLIEPIEERRATLSLGRREKVPRVSERFLSFIAGPLVDVKDTGTGYRALKKNLAEKMELRGLCPCGTFVLEASRHGADIVEVPVVNRQIKKPRGIAWRHLVQVWYVLVEGLAGETFDLSG